LAITIAWDMSSRPEAGVFVTESVDDLGAMGRRLLYICSAVFQGLALPNAYASRTHSRAAALLSLSLSIIWLAGLVYSQLV